MRRTALLAVLALAFAVAGVAASPAPVSVCGACGDGFERATERVGDPATVQHSTATVRVHANGSATWTVRNRLPREDARRLAENDTLRAAVESALEYNVGYGGDAPPTVLSTAVDGRNVTARYRSHGVVERSAGALRYTELRNDPGARLYVDLGADRVRYVAPEGYRVGYAPPAATVEDRTVTLTRVPQSGATRFLAFARGGAASLQGHAAVGLAVFPTVGRNVLLLVALPALAFGAVATGVRGGLRRWSPDLDARAVAGGVAALAAYALAHPVVPVPQVYGFNPLAATAGVAGLLLSGASLHPAVRERLDTRTALGLTFVAFAVGVVVAHLLRPAFDPVRSVPLALTLDRAAPGLLVLLGFPLGVAAARGEPRRALATLVGAAVLALAVWAPLGDRGGTFYLLGVFIAVGAGLLAPLAGAPLALLGFTTARAGRT